MISKKKLISFLAIGGLFTAISSSSIYAANLGFTVGDNVNLRKEASVNSSVISKIDSGQSVEILSVDGEWYKIKYNNDSSAYVSRQFIKLIQADGVIVENAVNLRSLPNTDSDIVSQISSGAVIAVDGIADSFYSVEYNGTKGYVHKDFVLGDLVKYVGKTPEVLSSGAAPAVNEPMYATITSSTGLNLRQTPSQDGNIISTLSSNTYVDVLETGAEWTKVSNNGTTGYVSTQFITINKGKKPENSKGTQIIEYAKQFLGTPYVWAGTNLRKGVDCSGFTYAVMRDNGININRSSRDQIKNGVNVSKNDLKTGDLVFFDTNNSTNRGEISHVGIYMGNGQFIHSSSSKKSYCVTISSLSEDYYTMRYVGATRVIN